MLKRLPPWRQRTLAATVALTMVRRQGLGDAKDLPVSHGRSTRPIAAAAATAAAKLRGRREMLLQVSEEMGRGVCALQETEDGVWGQADMGWR